jgi:hypothetical protein
MLTIKQLYNTSVSITGQDNLVDLNGTYKTGDGNLDLGYFEVKLEEHSGFHIE